MDYLKMGNTTDIQLRVKFNKLLVYLFQNTVFMWVKVKDVNGALSLDIVLSQHIAFLCSLGLNPKHRFCRSESRMDRCELRKKRMTQFSSISVFAVSSSPT